jgi:hypothetical protein
MPLSLARGRLHPKPGCLGEAAKGPQGAERFSSDVLLWHSAAVLAKNCRACNGTIAEYRG